MGCPVKHCVTNGNGKTAPLDGIVLGKLGFQYNGALWVHREEVNFAVKLEETCFYIAFRGYLAKYPYERLVEVLEKQFFERTRKLLF